MHNIFKSIVPVRVSKPTYIAIICASACVYWERYGYPRTNQQDTKTAASNSIPS